MNNKQETRIYGDGNRAVNFIPTKAEAVTPSDTTILQPGSLYVGTGGTLVVMLADDSSAVTLTNVPDGSFIPLLIKRVYDTTTDASDILILR